MKMTIQKALGKWSSYYLDKLWTIVVTYIATMEVVHRGWDLGATVLFTLLGVDVIIEIASKLTETTRS